MLQPPPINRPFPASAMVLERSRGVFFARWDELHRLRRIVLKSFDHDDIHDLRVASRRFRAVLELFYPFLPEGERSELKKSVRGLTRALGRLRTIDEALLFFRKQQELPASGTVCVTLAGLRREELKRTASQLAAFDHRALDRTVRQIIAGLETTVSVPDNRFSLLAYLSEVSIRLYLPIQQSFGIALQPEHAAERHAMRIAIKKWRYFLEVAQELLHSCDCTAILELLKEYQSLLGTMNDLKEFAAILSHTGLRAEQQQPIKELFAAEEKRLLKELVQHAGNKPIVYTFLI